MTRRHKQILAIGMVFLFIGMAALFIQTNILPAESIFSINRIELFFENRRAEITVDRNTPNLKAMALIHFTGTGLLQGQWQVDGRPIGFVSQQVFSDQTVTLQTPATPPIPTFDPGTHRLQFVPASPAPLIPLPTALYFVTAGEMRPVKMALLAPRNRSLKKYRPLTFKWGPLNNSAVYLIEFYNRSKESNPIYSAYTKDPQFFLDELCIGKICGLRGTYYWRVKGFDAQSAVVGESEVWSFQFK